MAVACRECDEQIVDNALFCEQCGATQYPDLVRPSALVVPERAPEHDPWLSHALRFAGVGMLLVLAWFTFIAGLVWRMHMLDVTGYRKRDVLWLWVPIAGTVVEVKTLWRYTARGVYWDERDDRPSDVLDGWPRPAAIAGGWVLGPAALAISAGITFGGDPVACVQDRVRDELGSSADDESPGEIVDLALDALDDCTD